MNELQVKYESFPERCEICHQTDCFDAQANYCSRCSELQIKDSTHYFQDKSNVFISAFATIAILAFLGSIVGAIIGMVFTLPLLSSHWWRSETWPILSLASWTMAGQSGLPLAFTRHREHIQIIARLSLWAISGAIGAILGPLCFGIATILFMEGTLDVTPVQYIRVYILWISMLGIIFGPLCGSILVIPLRKFLNNCRKSRCKEKRA